MNDALPVGNPTALADLLVSALDAWQMHRRTTAVRDFYRQRSYTTVPAAEHELRHPNYLEAIKSALDRIGGERLKSEGCRPTPKT